MARARKKRTRKPVTKAPGQKVPPRLQGALRIDNLLTLGTASPAEIDGVLSLLREQAEDEIEKLIAFVDRIAPDPDLEPSLGYNSTGGDDREGDDVDEEPSLGWTDMESRSGKPAVPSFHSVDAELDDSDDEDGRDGELSLGAPMNLNQTVWSQGEGGDREDDPAELGIGDEAGLSEQTVGEPSLGSFDRLTNQTHAWKQVGLLLVGDGEKASEIPTAQVDSRRKAYKAKHKYPYNGVGGVIIPIRR